MAKPFFYRLNAADFFAAVRDIPNKDCAKWLRTFASDLVAGSTQNEYTQTIIDEAKKFKEKKSLAGKEGMKNRYQKANSVITKLQQTDNTDITNSSSSNNSSTETEKITSTPYTRMSINDFRFLFTDNFKTSMPPGCNNLALEICQRESKEAIIGAFQIAAEQGKCSLAYVNGVLLGNGKKKTEDFDYDFDKICGGGT